MTCGRGSFQLSRARKLFYVPPRACLPLRFVVVFKQHFPGLIEVPYFPLASFSRERLAAGNLSFVIAVFEFNLMKLECSLKTLAARG